MITTDLLIAIPSAAFVVFGLLKAEGAYQMWRWKRMMARRMKVTTSEDAKSIGFVENAVNPQRCHGCGKLENTFHEYTDGTKRCLYCHIAGLKAVSH